MTDVNSCVLLDTFVITEPTAITATNITTDVSCNGLSDGSFHYQYQEEHLDIQKIGEVLIHLLYPPAHKLYRYQMLIHVFIQIQSL